jgi:sugar-specific transcriptional regulator TrmB
MDFKEEIKSAGLTENEAIVYTALLELGARPAGIISRKTGLHRRVIYDVTERLIKKGLIGYIIENNRKIFSASNPRRFLQIIDEERQKINQIIQNMLEFYNSEKQKQKEETLFFKGKSGLKSVFEDQLEDKDVKDILIISPPRLAYDVLPFYFKWFDIKRKKKKIKARIIFQKPKGEKLKTVPLSEVRFLEEDSQSPMAINIYGNKVAIVLWSKENPFAILIKQKEIADSYRKHFELLWKIAKKKKIKI